VSHAPLTERLFQQLVCLLVFDEGLPRVGGKELISDYLAIMNSGDKHQLVLFQLPSICPEIENLTIGIHKKLQNDAEVTYIVG